LRYSIPVVRITFAISVLPDGFADEALAGDR
jgi:hypothetical protein